METQQDINDLTVWAHTQKHWAKIIQHGQAMTKEYGYLCHAISFYRISKYNPENKEARARAIHSVVRNAICNYGGPVVYINTTVLMIVCNKLFQTYDVVTVEDIEESLQLFRSQKKITKNKKENCWTCKCHAWLKVKKNRFPSWGNKNTN
jgi:hypothetical protein